MTSRLRTPDIWEMVLCRTWAGFDFVTQDEIGAGIAGLVAGWMAARGHQILGIAADRRPPAGAE